MLLPVERIASVAMCLRFFDFFVFFVHCAEHRWKLIFKCFHVSLRSIVSAETALIHSIALATKLCFDIYFYVVSCHVPLRSIVSAETALIGFNAHAAMFCSNFFI